MAIKVVLGVDSAGRLVIADARDARKAQRILGFEHLGGDETHVAMHLHSHFQLSVCMPGPVLKIKSLASSAEGQRFGVGISLEDQQCCEQAQSAPE